MCRVLKACMRITCSNLLDTIPSGLFNTRFGFKYVQRVVDPVYLAGDSEIYLSEEHE